jgi:hypothetical protein
MGKPPPETMRADPAGIAGQVERRFSDELDSLRAFNDPQGLYARLPIELGIQ